MRNLNVAGGGLTFPDKYVKVHRFSISTDILAGDTLNTINLSSVIPQGYTSKDVITISIDSIANSVNWSTIGYVFDYPTNITFRFYTNGTTSQYYQLGGLMFLKSKAQNSY